jgi:3-hydroxyacyl-CoA dehydrogenase
VDLRLWLAVYRGGPMFWADTEGLTRIVEGLRGQQERLGPDFKLSELLVSKGAIGREAVKGLSRGKGRA